MLFVFLVYDSLDSGFVFSMPIVGVSSRTAHKDRARSLCIHDKQVSAKPGSPFDPPRCGWRRYRALPNANSSGVLTWDDSLGFGGMGCVLIVLCSFARSA